MEEKNCISNHRPGFPDTDDLLFILGIEMSSALGFPDEQPPESFDVFELCEFPSFVAGIKAVLQVEFPPDLPPDGLAEISETVAIRSWEDAAHIMDAVPNNYKGRDRTDNGLAIAQYFPSENSSSGVAGFATAWSVWDLDEWNIEFSAKEALHALFFLMNSDQMSLEVGGSHGIEWFIVPVVSPDASANGRTIFWHMEGSDVVWLAIGNDEAEVNDMIAMLNEGALKAAERINLPDITPTPSNIPIPTVTSDSSLTLEFVNTWGSEGYGPGQLKRPIAIAVDHVGNIFVAEVNRIQKFGSDGNLLTSWGTLGRREGELSFPAQIAVGPDNRLYVADTQNDRVQIFTAEGEFISSFGSSGEGHGELRTPAGIAVARDGTIIVSDNANHKILRFTSDGVLLNSWGSEGTGESQFQSPRDLAVDTLDRIYVLDYRLHSRMQRVQVFSSSGEFLSEIETTATALAVDYSGRIYLASNSEIEIVDFHGDLLGSWGFRVRIDSPYSPATFEPTSIGLDAYGHIYITDETNTRVVKFTLAD